MNTKLSDREKEVMACLMSGKSNDEIAKTLTLSVTTVKTHLRRMFSKLNVKSRLEAVAVYKNKTLKPLKINNMKNLKTTILGLITFASIYCHSQNNIDLSFIKLDEKENQIQKPESSSSKDKLLVLQLFDLESILKYEEITCVIETKDFHVDEYTFPIVHTIRSQELYDGADVSSSIKPGTKYKRLVIALAPEDNNPDGSGQFSISYTRNACGQKYIYSKEGNNGLKEYTLTAKVTGQNYKQVYNPKSDMYDIIPSHDPVLLSNVITIKIITSDKLQKQALDLTIGRKSDLFDAINQANEKTNELNGGNSKNKK
ncbi:MAG: helix-turn-helix transcriptional regulator [Bacteroidia bacterium]|nr:helix-turn-helix transcriptional regulator [Bacteroidia bacterium]